VTRHRRAELQKIYDSEINVRISWLWDGGIDLWLGDEVNGYVAEETVSAASEIARPGFRKPSRTSTRRQPTLFR
jgi:hypothetical protein